MRILVCIKQVPGTTKVEVDPVTGVLKRDGVEAKLNPYDLFALEEAFTLRERFGGTVTVLTMGPNQAKAALQETLAMGADRAALLSDHKFAGADVLATSFTLSQGVRLAGRALAEEKSAAEGKPAQDAADSGGSAPLGFDLILCGKQTTDGDTAQVGPELAEQLGIPHAANISEVTSFADGHIVVKTAFETYYQEQRMALPCLLTVEKDVNTPRLPSYKRRRAVRPEQIRVWSLADLPDKNEKLYGLSGSPTQVERIFPPEKNAGRERWDGTGAELTERLYRLLADRKFI